MARGSELALPAQRLEGISKINKIWAAAAAPFEDKLAKLSKRFETQAWLASFGRRGGLPEGVIYAEATRSLRVAHGRKAFQYRSPATCLFHYRKR